MLLAAAQLPKCCLRLVGPCRSSPLAPRPVLRQRRGSYWRSSQVTGGGTREELGDGWHELHGVQGLRWLAWSERTNGDAILRGLPLILKPPPA
jgi:hypothetical protein